MSKVVLVTRYNDRNYHSIRKSYRSYIDLSKVSMVDKLEEGKDCFKIYFDNSLPIYIAKEDYEVLLKAWRG